MQLTVCKSQSHRFDQDVQVQSAIMLELQNVDSAVDLERFDDAEGD
jgi:hypothetical protein